MSRNNIIRLNNTASLENVNPNITMNKIERSILGVKDLTKQRQRRREHIFIRNVPRDSWSSQSGSSQFTVVRELPKRRYDGSRGSSQKLRVPITKLYNGKGGQMQRKSSVETWQSRYSSQLKSSINLQDIQSPPIFSQPQSRMGRENWTELRRART